MRRESARVHSRAHDYYEASGTTTIHLQSSSVTTVHTRHVRVQVPSLYENYQYTFHIPTASTHKMATATIELRCTPHYPTCSPRFASVPHE